MTSQEKTTPMRSRIRKQLRLVEPAIDHEHSKELAQIRKVLAERPEIGNMVYADLVRSLDDPESGREGMMTAEQVFKVIIVKQMNGFSYDTLRFHLADSRTYRWFCGFGIADPIPSESTLQRDVKKVRPETMEAINRVLLGAAVDRGIERGRKVCVDCTVIESNIHRPTDHTEREEWQGPQEALPRSPEGRWEDGHRRRTCERNARAHGDGHHCARHLF
jgi:IS5 family transposase